jgi:shikimate dehydrogenase
MSLAIDTSTRVCAVIGDPVEHSLSPRLHNAAFNALDLNYAYVAFQVKDVGACLGGMRAMPGFRGMSVTIPHKVAVMDYLDEISPLARQIGCVNTITNEDGRLMGSNTDGSGTLRAFKEAGVDLKGKKILFLGSGGAVRAVAFAMAMEAQPAELRFLARKVERLERLAADLREGTQTPATPGQIDTLKDCVQDYDIIINGTPIGMYPNAMDQSLIPPSLLRSEQVVFDMVYRPMKTRLIREAESVGATTILGLEMLLNQAELQFETWTGCDAPSAVMRNALVGALSERGG